MLPRWHITVVDVMFWEGILFVPIGIILIIGPGYARPSKLIMARQQATEDALAEEEGLVKQSDIRDDENMKSMDLSELGLVFAVSGIILLSIYFALLYWPKNL